MHGFTALISLAGFELHGLVTQAAPRKLGFVEVPLGPTEYRRANIKMVLQLEAGLKGM